MDKNVQKGLESGFGVNIFALPSFNAPRQNVGGAKEVPRKRSFLRIIFSEKYLEKVLTEPTGIDVVELFPSWESAL